MGPPHLRGAHPIKHLSDGGYPTNLRIHGAKAGSFTYNVVTPYLDVGLDSVLYDETCARISPFISIAGRKEARTGLENR
jgi:hypothetical protein